MKRLIAALATCLAFFGALTGAWAECFLRLELSGTQGPDGTPHFDLRGISTYYGFARAGVAPPFEESTAEYELVLTDDRGETLESFGFNLSAEVIFEREEEGGGIFMPPASEISVIVPFRNHDKVAEILVRDGHRTTRLPFERGHLSCSPTCSTFVDVPVDHGVTECCAPLRKTEQPDGTWVCTRCGDGVCSPFEDESCLFDCEGNERNRPNRYGGGNAEVRETPTRAPESDSGSSTEAEQGSSQSSAISSGDAVSSTGSSVSFDSSSSVWYEARSESRSSSSESSQGSFESGSSSSVSSSIGASSFAESSPSPSVISDTTPTIAVADGMNLPAGDFCGELEETARRLIAYPDVERLTLVNATELAYECLERRACAYKFTSIDRDFMVVVRADGAELDLVRELDEDALVCREKYGLLDRELHEMLSTIAPDEHLSIALILDDEHTLTTLPEIDPATGSPAVSPESVGIARTLEERGYGKFRPIPGFINFLFGQASRDTIAGLGAARDLPGVREITLLPADAPRLNVSHAMIGARSMHEAGATGKGVKVAVMESHSVAGLPIAGRYSALFTAPNLDRNNPSLGCVAVLSPFLAKFFVTEHGSQVTEVLCGRDTKFPGIAPGVDVWGGGGVGLPERAVDALLSKLHFGTRVMNHSYAEGGPKGAACTRGGLSLGSMIFDAAAYLDVLSVAAAGNPPGDSAVCNPAAGYNTIAVAGYATGGVLDVKGLKIMNPPLLPPSSGLADRTDKPEVSAPWEKIRGGLESDGTVRNLGTGTSLASPAVAGAAALVLEANSKASPWLTKAILMATAIQKIGGTRQLGATGWPTLDRKTGKFFYLEGGVGGVRADLAVKLAQGVGGITKEISVANCVLAEKEIKIRLDKDQRVRAVIAWDVHPYYRLYKRIPTADIDLRLVGPDGKKEIVAHSVTFDNSTEALETKIAAAGEYVLQMPVMRCADGGDAKYAPQRLALAVYTGSFDEPDFATFIDKKNTFIGRSSNKYCLMAEAPTEILSNRTLEARVGDTIVGTGVTDKDGCVAVATDKNKDTDGSKPLKIVFKGDAGNGGYKASSMLFDRSMKIREQPVIFIEGGPLAQKLNPRETVRRAVSLRDMFTDNVLRVKDAKIEVVVLGPLEKIPADQPVVNALAFAPEAQRASIAVGENGKAEFSFTIPADVEPGQWFAVRMIFAGDAKYLPVTFQWELGRTR